MGFLHADVCYDVVHVWKGSFFRLKDHLNRFEKSYNGLGLKLSYTKEQIGQILIDIVRKAQLKDSYVYVGATRGTPTGDPRDYSTYQNALYAFAIPFVWIIDEEEQKVGVDLIVSSVQRIAKEAIDPTIKNHHWGDLTRASFEAEEKGAKTAILLDAKGNVTEGPGFNIFAVHKGKLITPDSNVLEGITRMTVLELAQEMKIKAKARKVPVRVLREAEEIFLSTTAGGVMPVKSLDDKPVGAGKPGAITMKLRDAYWKAHDDPRYSTPVNYA
jgi:branched-chain amino acid aminotransferase